MQTRIIPNKRQLWWNLGVVVILCRTQRIRATVTILVLSVYRRLHGRVIDLAIIAPGLLDED